MLKDRQWIFALLVLLAGLVHAAKAQHLSIVRVTLGPDQIGTIRTAPGITTRVSFAEPVKEIICGDLYDPGTGKGIFVVQRSDNDIFLKPISARGMTNLFVKTGEKGENVYNFDLVIGRMVEAHRAVHVGAPAGSVPHRVQRPGEQPDDDSNRALSKAADIERNANKQAGRIIAEAEQKAADLNRQAAEEAAETERLAKERADHIERRFVYAMMDGSREVKVTHPKVVASNVIITFDRRVVIFDGKSYLRYIIQNNGADDFVFTAISIEASPDKKEQADKAEVIQNKPENRIAPKEAIKGVIIFSPDLLNDNDRLTVLVRGQDNVAIARASIQ